ncbi:hypothetical protein N7468_007248 [Penicillium chermesinum]|uniref:Protein transport protein SEC31 n=1 Tax=Penicillium chermesinum TaxID=63820 RepID=A0A9W9TKG9_9EURO|nr:uncharacterized protein N7468_007248 [Penicillium chermesinum]KAJ5226023.1 hypothetical protein N7468_007248 [Penicillium chermesinum]
MVRLREIPRTATFAWSPGAASPLIATGTRAGAVDADFSNKTCLELWDLSLDHQDASEELQPLAKIDTDSGFNDIAWANFDESKRGVIAGGLENGSLNLWNADKLIAGASDSLMSRTSNHSGAIKALQFNPKHSNLLASGGAKGELFIHDLNNIENPFRLGNNAARTDDIECLDWNKKVAHIMVTGSSAGFVTVWDVKTKKESLTLNNMGRKAVSAVAWDPEKPTKLITSTPLDSDPMIYVWDLRNSHAPERTLSGHESGVLSLSWCDQDPDLMLSSGKDNRNICWNPQTGQAYGEFPVVTNWTFQTRWNPHNPNFFATASFDGRISIQTLQNTKTDSSQAIADQNQALDGEDFFAKAQTQPQVSKFSLPKPPRWMERPCGASFGFGGRVVSVGLVDKAKRASKIQITPFEVDESVGNATESFEAALKEGDLRSLCESRAAKASSDEEKIDWKVFEALLSENPRKGLVEYLGFQDQADEAADSLEKLGIENKEGDEANGEAEKPKAPVKKHKRLQSMFDATPDDNFLTDLAASKGARTNNPFQIFNGSETEAEKSITRALLLGEFEKALDVALKEDRLSDAFMIAICGGQKCIEKAQEYYFSKQVGGPNYMRLLASIVGKNLWDVVHNADLSNWKEVMAALCTFADEKEFPDLCDALGDRLEEQYQESGDKAGRKDASFCFLAGSKLEKVVSIWVEELRENEQKGIETDTDSSTFSVHVRALQGLIEKVTIFRQVTKFQDLEQSKDSDWRLHTLYEKYIEYADVCASHGRLEVAQKYLDLVPEKHPEAEVARNRIRLATRQAPASRTAQRTATPQGGSKPLPLSALRKPYGATPSPYVPPAQAAAPASASPYTPASAQVPPPNPFATFGGAGAAAAPSTTGFKSGGYQPTGGIKPSPYGPATPFGGQPAAAGVPPPPRNQSPANTVTTYTTATNLPAWNDLPEGFAKSTPSRTRTPAAASATISSPFPNQSPPVAGQRPPSVPPPPRGAAPPPRVTSPLASSVASPPPPVNPYASLPQSPPTGATMAPPASIPRGPSPYNPPPSMPPANNRYAPSPASQVQTPPVQSSAGATPYGAPVAAQTPPPNPYAPRASAAAVQPPPMASRVPSSPQAARPGFAPPPPANAPRGTPPQSSPQAPPAIHEILSREWDHIKARAPPTPDGRANAKIENTTNSLNVLYQQINSNSLQPETLGKLGNFATAIQSRQYDVAESILDDLKNNHPDESRSWEAGPRFIVKILKSRK